MRLLNRTAEAKENVDSARFQVDLALLKMEELLDQVKEQVEKAKEERGGRRPGAKPASG